MSRKSDIVLGGIWVVIDAAVALAGFEDVAVIRGSRRPEGAGSPCLTVFWLSEARPDSHYALDELYLQVVLWEANEDDSGLSEDAVEIAEAVDIALNNQSIGVDDAGEAVGTWTITRDGIPMPSPEGFDQQSNEYFRIMRYRAIVG